MISATRHHLVIFVRYPQLGAGKRRLAAGVGAVTALRFQRVRLTILLNTVGRDPRWKTWLAVTPDRSGPWPQNFGIVRQGRGDLGVRMERVFQSLPAGPAIIVGSDIPGVTSVAISRAFDALEGCDAVFGPARDGGYWLVGLARTIRPLSPFPSVRWSSRYALADTLSNLTGARVAVVGELDDVDDLYALRRADRWQRMLPMRG